MIFITESWLRYDFPDSLILSKTSYSLFRKDRPDGYGGVAVFVSNLLKVVSIDIPPMYSSLECVALDLVLSKASCYRFICVYHPPSCAASSVDTANLCSLIDSLSMTTYPLFIVGDFNLPNINWYVPISLGSSSHDLFLTCMMRNGLLNWYHILRMDPIALIWFWYPLLT